MRNRRQYSVGVNGPRELVWAFTFGNSGNFSRAPSDTAVANTLRTAMRYWLTVMDENRSLSACVNACSCSWLTSEGVHAPKAGSMTPSRRLRSTCKLPRVYSRLATRDCSLRTKRSA